MSSSVPPPLLSGAAGGAKPSRSASAVVAKKAQGFQVFRIDGYSVTTTLPGGERITSEAFEGRLRLHRALPPRLRLAGSHKKERVRAAYKFSLLDPAGTAAYELPKETAIFTAAAHVYGAQREEEPGDPGRGYACFITKDELRKRGESLLREDSLAIRCDVGVAEVGTLDVAPERRRSARPMRPAGGYCGGGGYGSPDKMYGEHEGWRSQPPPTDDREYIRRCLTAQR
ncbi:hypothetical protein C2845_PM13G03480 [Panicum miliaceum]|uniref:Uncharacterized protein n=1 Tax=Panicum miliaceum TaxID=4540 RepID=A0A3L6RG44_PANMI|nr:hypothetical protein C2845_PM13G03480 [Panicum miliaceum]